eukprot:UC4_evm1s1452
MPPSSALPISHPPLIFRRLLPSDQDQLRRLHEDWFPIRYPERFYHDSSCVRDLYFSCAAIDTAKDTMVGVIIAHIRPAKHLEKEDKDIVACPSSCNTVAYVKIDDQEKWSKIGNWKFNCSGWKEFKGALYNPSKYKNPCYDDVIIYTSHASDQIHIT